MLIHPVFPGIMMHSDYELAEILGVGIKRRNTIHEWPLSCVQRLCLDDGTKLIYKAQLQPTVEPLFYDCASSKLLPGHRVLGKLGNCDIMTIEWIDAPLLCMEAYSDIEFVEHGKRIVAQIGEIRGKLPVYLDIGSTETWSSVGQDMLEKLCKLVMNGQFKSVDLSEVECVRSWTTSAKVYEAITGNPRVVHGDLKADQVFVTIDGYRVIDWQRPVMAPPEIDLVSLLVGQHIDPCRFVDAAIAGIFWFLRLCWAVEAQFDLFPDKRWELFDKWASEAIAHILES